MNGWLLCVDTAMRRQHQDGHRKCFWCAVAVGSRLAPAVTSDGSRFDSERGLFDFPSDLITVPSLAETENHSWMDGRFGRYC